MIIIQGIPLWLKISLFNICFLISNCRFHLLSVSWVLCPLYENTENTIWFCKCSDWSCTWCCVHSANLMLLTSLCYNVIVQGEGDKWELTHMCNPMGASCFVWFSFVLLSLNQVGVFLNELPLRHTWPFHTLLWGKSFDQFIMLIDERHFYEFEREESVTI